MGARRSAYSILIGEHAETDIQEDLKDDDRAVLKHVLKNWCRKCSVSWTLRAFHTRRNFFTKWGNISFQGELSSLGLVV